MLVLGRRSWSCWDSGPAGEVRSAWLPARHGHGALGQRGHPELQGRLVSQSIYLYLCFNHYLNVEKRKQGRTRIYPLGVLFYLLLFFFPQLNIESKGVLLEPLTPLSMSLSAEDIV